MQILAEFGCKGESGKSDEWAMWTSLWDKSEDVELDLMRER
jgi:hypothetical protein